MKKANCQSFKIKDSHKFKGIIYVLTNTLNGKQYVGQSTQAVEVRIKWHEYDSNRIEQKFLIHLAFKEYGLDNFEYRILHDIAEGTKVDRDRRLNELERFYIRKLNTKTPFGYNSTSGGRGTNGFKHKEESIMVRVEKFKGRFMGSNNPLFGIPLSAEHREKISRSRRGKGVGESNHNYNKPLPLEVRNKISEKLKVLHAGSNNPFYGKKHSTESKERISQSKKGKQAGENHPFFGKHHTEESKIRNRKSNKKRIPIVMIDSKTGMIIRAFDSIRFAGKWIQENINHSGNNSVIRRALDSETNLAYGFVWKRFEDYTDIKVS